MELMDLVTGRTRILVEGSWLENQTELIRDNTPIEITEEMQAVAQARFESRKAKNPALFDGDVLSLDMEKSKFQPGAAVFVVKGPMKYSVYDVMRRENIEKMNWRNFPIGTGLSVVAVSADQKMIMQATSAYVDFPDKLALVGGIYDGGTPFECMRKELEEEMGIPKDEIKEMRLIGVSNRLEERINHEFQFLTQVSMTSEQIKKTAETAKDKEGRLFFLDVSPQTIREFLMNNRPKITANNFGCLILSGRHLWGKEWSEIPG